MRPVVAVIALSLSACNLFGASSATPSSATDVGTDAPTFSTDASNTPDTAMLDSGTAGDTAPTTDTTSRGDVPTPDLGNQDAPEPDLGDPLDPCDEPGILFCSGFEVDDFADWTSGENGVASIQTDIVRTGESAGLFEAPSGVGSAAASTTIAQTVPGSVWIRAFLYLSESWQSDYVEWSQLTTSSGYVLGIFGNNYVGLQNSTRGQDAQESFITTLPRQRWICMEWMISIGSPAPATFAVDGVTVVDTTIDFNFDGSVETFSAGLNFGVNVVDGLYVDEVVVSANRPGCD